MAGCAPKFVRGPEEDALKQFFAPMATNGSGGQHRASCPTTVAHRARGITSRSGCPSPRPPAAREPATRPSSRACLVDATSRRSLLVRSRHAATRAPRRPLIAHCDRAPGPLRVPPVHTFGTSSSGWLLRLMWRRLRHARAERSVSVAVAEAPGRASPIAGEPARTAPSCVVHACTSVGCSSCRTSGRRILCITRAASRS